MSSAKAIRTVLLGPSGVGKTTLLTVLYKEVTTLNKYVRIAADMRSAQPLQTAYINLLNWMHQAKYGAVARDLLPPTQTFREYLFSATMPGVLGSRVIRLYFVDGPGRSLYTPKPVSSDAIERESRRLQTEIEHSGIIINVIDASAMMELSPGLSELVNAHSVVAHLLTETLVRMQDSGIPLLVVFALVKCEQYMNDVRDRDLLRARFHERHQEVLDALDVYGSVEAWYMPVQTLGNVVVACVDNEKASVNFKVTGPLAPKGVRELATLVLDFAIRTYDQRRSPLSWLFDLLAGVAPEQVRSMLDTDFGPLGAVKLRSLDQKQAEEV